MRDADGIPAPKTKVIANDAHFEILLDLDLSGVPELRPEQPWHVGLSAVIESTEGEISYWALAHRPGRADFHHPDCFVFVLAPA